MKKKIQDIISDLEYISIIGDANMLVEELIFDSKKATSKSIFFAVRGTIHNGHDFVQNAYDNGCRAFVLESDMKLGADCVCIMVKNSSKFLALASSNFYDAPSSKMNLIGVTGTNGKTTVATLLHDLFTSLGHFVGLLSTVENKIGQEVIPSTHTTPDSVAINMLLHKMVQEGCEYVFMEVSSHAIHQNRTLGLKFKGAVFTNISHDHLDYHKTFTEYIKVKTRLFDQLDKEAFALTNVDDRNGNVVVQNTIANRYSYALKSPADFKVKIIENQLSGLLVNLNGKELSTRLIGRFNAYNLTAIYASAILLNQDELEVLCALSNLSSAEGRFEPYKGNNGVTAIIDYAHTPDALENVLDTILSFKKKGAKLYTVVGCGGNRDVDKRPKMASIAFSKSDYVFFTSDNPRSEDPQEIINQMLSGIENQEDSNVFEVLDRQQAIKMALSFASENDVVLIAGKGHEKYQEINGVRHHFDDKEIAKKYLKN